MSGALGIQYLERPLMLHCYTFSHRDRRREGGKERKRQGEKGASVHEGKHWKCLSLVGEH